MGIALYVVLSRLVSFPIFENYYICLGYFVMAVYLYSFDTFSGTLIGTLGTFLYCVLINGLRGMPGWVCGNLVIGILLGFCFKYVKQNKIKSKLFLTFITYFTVVVSVVLGILGVKSLVEMFLYSQPFVVRIANNIYAFVADLIVLCLAIPLCKYVDKIIKKQSMV